MKKFELHAHTAECDVVAKLGGADLVKSYIDAGYDGMVITDHYFSHFYEWFSDEISEQSQKSVIDRYLKGYRAARDLVEVLKSGNYELITPDNHK